MAVTLASPLGDIRFEPLRRTKSDYPSLLFWLNTAR